MPAHNAKQVLTFAVAGNPNCGKTCLFNEMTGGTQTVGNYPGVTVEEKRGSARIDNNKLDVVDLPGIYSLTAYSQDEIVARNFIAEEAPDVIINVINATSLERNLYLTLQLLEMRVPMVIALNMVDIAERRGIKIDTQRLSEELGCPIIETVGYRGIGIDETLRAAVERARQQKAAVEEQLSISYPAAIENGIQQVTDLLKSGAVLKHHNNPRWLATKMIETDPEIVGFVELTVSNPAQINDNVRQIIHEVESDYDDTPASLIAEHRYDLITDIMERVIQSSPDVEETHTCTLTDKIDRLVCNRVAGPFLVAACIYLVFKLVFFFANDLAFIPWIRNGEITLQSATSAFERIFTMWLPSLFQALPDGAFKSLIIDGILAGVGGVLSFVPVIFVMFVFLSLLEDSGYIARIAFVLDRLLSAFGLQGKSIMAMIVAGGIAGGCAVPGVMATRIMREEKDRLTTMLVAPFMNCGAKIPLYSLLIAAFFSAHKGEMLFLVAVLSWGAALSAAFVLRQTVTSGEQTPFMMEMHPYHAPHWRSVFNCACQRTWMYIQKAGTIILGVSIILWAAMYFPRQDPKILEHQNQELLSQLHEDLSETLPGITHVTNPDELATMLNSLQRLTSKPAATSITSLLEAEWLTKPSQQFVNLEHTQQEVVTDKLTTYLKQLAQVEHAFQQKQIKLSFAGRIGRFLEPASEKAGFDWRTNIALLGGFTAKEVIVSTLGTAHSLGTEQLEELDDGASGNALTRKLRAAWSPIQGFALIVFVMIYAPCVATVTVIWRESGSWKWAAFSVIYSTIAAYLVAVAVYQAGTILFS